MKRRMWIVGVLVGCGADERLHDREPTTRPAEPPSSPTTSEPTTPDPTTPATTLPECVEVELEPAPADWRLVVDTSGSWDRRLDRWAGLGDALAGFLPDADL